MKEKCSIGGMSCSACSNGIEKAVSKIDGVKIANVSLLQKSMTVEFDEQKTTAENIIHTVERLGYSAKLFGQDEEVKTNKTLRIVCLSLIFLLPLLYFSMGGMIGLPLPNRKLNYAIQCVLALIVIILNKRFYVNGVRAVMNLSPNMDTLVALGSFSAFSYSLVESILLWTGVGVVHVFFEASAMVLVLVTLGKWLEEKSKDKTGKEIEKLSKLIPKTVKVIRDGKEITLNTNELIVGDLIVAKAGDYVAVDGVVESGNATLDKSAITGESLPEEVAKNQYVTSGSIVKSGYVVIKATAVGEQTLFSKIISAVQNTGTSKAPVQKLADQISKWFVPSVTIISIITFVIWMVIKGDLYTSFGFAISVLVVSCPCALGLATPVAITAATGKGASMGIWFKCRKFVKGKKRKLCYFR